MYSQRIYYLVSVLFLNIHVLGLLLVYIYIFLFDISLSLQSLSLMLIDVSMPFVIQGLGLIFSSFLVDCLANWCMSIKSFIEKLKKCFKTQIYITIFCGKVPGLFLMQIPFQRVNVKASKVSVQVVLNRSCFRLLPLKFSKIINRGRWSEIEVVILPERYLKDGLFTKMLSIQY